MQESPTRGWFGPLHVAVAVALVATATAQAVTVVRHEPEPPRLLRLNVTEGMTFTYRTEMEMDARVGVALFNQPFELTSVLEQEWTVTDVAEDGSVTVEIETELVDASTSLGDIPAEEIMPVEGTTTMRLAPDGRILDASLGITGAFTGPVNLPALDGLSPVFPDDPVVPGDRWDLGAELPILPGGPTLVVSGESRLDGYEEAKGIRAAVIESETSIPFDFEVDVAEVADALGEGALPDEEAEGVLVYDGDMTATGRQWVDPETGLQIRAEVTATADIGFSLGGFPQNGDTPSIPRTNVEFDLTMTLERL